MTTICTDGRTVAADGKSCLGDRPVSLRTQKIVVSNGTLYALSGPECMIRPIIEWWERGHDHATVPVAKDEGCAWTLMVIDPGGTVIMTSRCQFPSPIPSGVFAIGSGADYAMGAMLAGKSPREAIAIASRCDVWTGGDIQEVVIAEAVGWGVPNQYEPMDLVDA